MSVRNVETLHGRTQCKSDQASAKLDPIFTNMFFIVYTVCATYMYVHIHIHVRYM